MTLVQLNILFYAIAVLLLVISAAVAFVRLRQTWHTRKPEAHIEQGNLPSDLSPAAAEMLLHIGRDNETNLLAATLLDLARRGYMRVVYTPELVTAGLADIGNAFMVVRNADTTEAQADFLRPYEATLLKTLFRAAYEDTVPLPLARRTYYEAVENGENLSDGVQAVLLQRRLIDVRKRTIHLISLGLLMPLAVACIGLTLALVLSPSLFVDWSGLATLAACAALELLIVAVLIAYDLRLRTPAGRSETQHWQTYARTLAARIDERDVAYAVAFGISATLVVEKIDVLPLWVHEGTVEAVARADLPKPDAVADAAGQSIARLQPHSTPPPDSARTRELLTTFVAALMQK